jgi:hypothetical protein
MTVCPIALMATCAKCPAFGYCPLKEVLGDHKPDASQSETTNSADQKKSEH